MAVVLGLLAALAYGTSDFVAGLATKRSTALAVVTGVQVAALLSALLGLLVLGGRPTGAAVGWGLLVAGPGAALGGMALYHGLATARMNVVAPLSGVVAAVIPVVVGVATGDRPGVVATAGIAMAVVAIALVSLSGDPDDGQRGSGVVEGLAAGIGFGALFVGLQRPGASAGGWTLVCTEIGGTASLLLLGLLRRRLAWPDRMAWPGAAVAGVLAYGGTLLYVLATRHGLLSVVAVLVSLYPASTVVLAAVLLRERSTWVQLVGMIAATVAVSLITIA